MFRGMSKAEMCHSAFPFPNEPDTTVPGIGKLGNLLEITDTDVWLRVQSCSKEPENKAIHHNAGLTTCDYVGTGCAQPSSHSD